MGYKPNDHCLKKAHNDEPIFVLLARDPTAPELVIEWIKENIASQPEEKLREAFEHALRMQQSQGRMLGRKKHVEAGYTYMIDGLPPDESEVEVIYAAGGSGKEAWLSKSEGFRGWESMTLEGITAHIVAWRNPTRLTA